MVFVFLFLTNLVWYPLVTSILLPMALFHSLLWLNNIVYMYHMFFIHSSVKGHLGCFRVLAVVNPAAVNINVRVSFWIIVVLTGYMPRSGIAMSHGNSFFFFNDGHSDQREVVPHYSSDLHFSAWGTLKY